MPSVSESWRCESAFDMLIPFAEVLFDLDIIDWQDAFINFLQKFCVFVIFTRLKCLQVGVDLFVVATDLLFGGHYVEIVSDTVLLEHLGGQVGVSVLTVVKGGHLLVEESQKSFG